MSVKFGSFDDPSDMQGLAHLIEHMVFSGSTIDGGENDFKDFVGMHGGDVFANTEPEYMGFSFTIVKDHFKAALEMFANMFNEPLMDIERFKKEMKTLNSEFESNKYKDTSRMVQLFSHTSPVNHPFNRFTWGNNQSFSGHEPQALRDCALKLFRSHFVGGSMKLVIIGSEAVDELEDLVIEYFSNLKRWRKTNFVFPEFNDRLWKHGVSYTLESLEDAQSMKISWIIPPISLSHSEIRPEQLIHILICEESEGSLCFFFKSKHWITSFTASVGHEYMFSDVGNCSFSSTAGGQLFTINLDMTHAGLENKYEMVSYIYQYLHMLRTCGSSTLLLSLIEDYKLLLQMKYQCMDSDCNQLGDPVNFSLALAVNMLSFPVSHAVSLDFCYEFGDLTAVQDMLRNFTTNNMRIDLLTKSFTKEEETQEEPYFSSKYKEEPIPHHYLQKWESSQFLHFPQRNSFMPATCFWKDVPDYLKNEEILDVDHEDKTGDVENSNSDEMEEDPDSNNDVQMDEDPDSFEMEEDLDSDSEVQMDEDPDSCEMEEDLVSDTSEEADDEETPYQPIIVDGHNKLFYRHQVVALSTACFNVYMNVSPGVIPHMVARIYFEMLKHELSPIIYRGVDAYVYPQLSFRDDNTIEIELYGYAGTIRDFMSSFCEEFRSFVPTLEVFEIITEKMLRQFYLTSRDLIVHGKQLLSEFIIEGQLSMDEKFNAMKLISFEDLNAFLPKTQQIRIVGLFSGSFSEDYCKQILGLFKPFGEFEIPRKSGTKKELALISPYRVSAMPITEIESNSLAKVYYQMTCEENSKDFKSNRISAFLHLLKSMVDEQIYTDLRLKQRLGYLVGCEIHNQHGTKGVYFYVVSSEHKPMHLLEKIYEFVASLRHYLVNVEEKTFELYKSGIDVPDDSDMSSDLIHDDSCIRGHHTAVKLVLKTMKKEDVIEIYDHFLVQKPLIVEVCIGSDI